MGDIRVEILQAEFWQYFETEPLLIGKRSMAIKY
jgi:hypothetical protein